MANEPFTDVILQSKLGFYRQPLRPGMTGVLTDQTMKFLAPDGSFTYPRADAPAVPVGTPLPAPTPLPPTVPAQPSTGDKPLFTVGPGQQFEATGEGDQRVGAIAKGLKALSLIAIGQGHDARALVGELQILPVPADPKYYLNDYVPRERPYALGFLGGDLTLSALPLYDSNGKRLLFYMPIEPITDLEYGKAPFDVTGKFTLKGGRIDGRTPTGNIAAIRTESGSFVVTVEDSELVNWGNCVFGTTPGGGEIYLKDTLVQNGGTDNNTQHCFYMARIDKLVCDGVVSIGGPGTCHDGKMRGLETHLINSIFSDGTEPFYDKDGHVILGADGVTPRRSDTSYGFDKPEGGKLLVRGLTIIRRFGQNWPAFAFGAELPGMRQAGTADNREHSIDVDGLTVISDFFPDKDHPLGTVAFASGITCPWSFKNVSLWNVTRQFQSPDGIDLPMPGGAVVLDKRPVVNLGSPAFQRPA